MYGEAAEAYQIMSHAPIIVYPLRIFVTYVQAITQRKTNQELYEKHLCNQSSHYEKYEWCRMPQLKVLHSPIIVWKVKYSLHFFVNYFQFVTQQYKSRPN